ncbi:hypothetical protein BH09PAT2_BH09PAT2_00790 [soil metagenome]
MERQYSFLGINHNIYPDGTYYPPEMIENLTFAKEVLRYEIDPMVWESLGMAT